MTSVCIICSPVFIHNSRSENGRKTTASERRLCVGEFPFLTLTFIAGFPQADFDTKLVNFFLKLVLPVILKELPTLRIFQKLSHKISLIIISFI